MAEHNPPKDILAAGGACRKNPAFIFHGCISVKVPFDLACSMSVSVIAKMMAAVFFNSVSS
ncbi:hypothetical protein LU004_00005, partial [Neisseria gonorrhoeae]|nr:hypothetical protein [Neisseria gonorrhoeae]